ncbi:MAG: hypothetical protein KKG09_01215 [Verrucomicrobia bacterium]|nr:hypothetical protein [Verrucomicrobiota bacterium]MCG2681196.1 hypothetical protein [Kiritimatiellia bacterium]MBU4246778.1 hypothetical protein [Verrucomicrobiota bacterium]MBU4290588.1 hypothetical protein [Verrucomicrobiota bacterium]MBU4429729.1 hypothetical protein [Verrucomicrobiota bacterium]
MYRLGQKEIDEVSKVIKAQKMFRVGDPKTGHLQEANRFEVEWAQTIGVKHALLLSGGGTAALMAGLAGMLADLRRIRARFVVELKGNPGIRFAPSNDPRGDCGVVVGFQFEREAAARAFAKAEGVGGGLPIDSGKHVYSNWDPILKHRVGHHPVMNPYRMPKNKGLRLNYTKNTCPRTLDILKRTVFISLHPDWTEAQISKRIAACRAAGAHG